MNWSFEIANRTFDIKLLKALNSFITTFDI